jgi:mannan endo-1,4-beta-mannosidase
MKQQTKQLLLLALCLAVFLGCKGSDEIDNSDKTAPTLIVSTPANNETNVAPSTTIVLAFSEKIKLSTNAAITLNGQAVQASVSNKNVSINASLTAGTAYTLNIPVNSITDEAGNSAATISIAFTTAAPVVPVGIFLEAENATLTNGAEVKTDIVGYKGTGYVATNAGNVTFSVNIEKAGYYDLEIQFANIYDEKTNDLYVDNIKVNSVKFPAQSYWGAVAGGKVNLTAGTHTIAIVKNWGYIQLDYLRLIYDAVGPAQFNISPALVTPSPSPQAVKLYDFLKESFGKKVILGAMANYSTNIDEATWVFNQTGKWPALAGFDFIDHTKAGQSWVKYDAPFTLGQDWWNNNGIVTLMWHWRDPLTKTGAFYTADTNFDVSKVSDVNSAEYKAMIVDIDAIAVYLKQFKDANIPVLWRPLHEASGRWFWWGAKGAEPCKALWKIMFNRLVAYHGLNNLIWVWTSDAAEDAANWYPGDAYVDMIGMDIYPGENQHGSQYISYNKVKEFSKGKKMLTLSECGSAPDPALMKEYGDMWSWFMPWNGTYTRDDKHNGATWWNKFFSADYVLTRDKMPPLK